MISSLSGQVSSIGPDFAVIKAGSFGMRVYMPARSLLEMRSGAEVDVYTNLVVREDSLTLFGFLLADESEAFDILQGVSGIGPKTALAALNVYTPDELRAALAAADEKMLQKIPGIGKKSAQRMILEIGDKLGPAKGLTLEPQPVADEVADEVIAALQSLGWQKQQAQAAVDQFAGSGLNASDMLRAALVNLGGNRG
ncbi:Holliday junction branch migration protein RuvA [Gleimia europaea]|uniref:Holliday junction branch migration complex subunit RuvA n=1 Tax=Gleimia europaea ACS-120-V-Col10b TaxID=883069 RepID=A0A9W5VVZ0_9ACTO|nr:Holliday junction branch migration protein RuvA [Gleimia europaea]EPD30427.1 Holliday junction DNA helicase RuvA [Gleimia europaea ACS-120-V-Col10b]